ARVLARRGDIEQAEALAGQAVSLGEQTDFLNTRADALLDFANILHLAGCPEAARARAVEALDLYQQKGNSVAAVTASSFLDRMTDDVTASGGSADTVAAGPIVRE
ncbi:MAG: hypothetical protein WAN22_02850, partial [Solirubrobacteraceae bacterium]